MSQTDELDRTIVVATSVLFTIATISVLGYLIFWATTESSADGITLLRSFFPVINNYGWYFTCYFALFFSKNDQRSATVVNVLTSGNVSVKPNLESANATIERTDKESHDSKSRKFADSSTASTSRMLASSSINCVLSIFIILCLGSLSSHRNRSYHSSSQFGRM